MSSQPQSTQSTETSQSTPSSQGTPIRFTGVVHNLRRKSLKLLKEEVKKSKTPNKTPSTPSSVPQLGKVIGDVRRVSMHEYGKKIKSRSSLSQDNTSISQDGLYVDDNIKVNDDESLGDEIDNHLKMGEISDDDGLLSSSLNSNSSKLKNSVDSQKETHNEINSLKDSDIFVKFSQDDPESSSSKIKKKKSSTNVTEDDEHIPLTPEELISPANITIELSDLKQKYKGTPVEVLDESDKVDTKNDSLSQIIVNKKSDARNHPQDSIKEKYIIQTNSSGSGKTTSNDANKSNKENIPQKSKTVKNNKAENVIKKLDKEKEETDTSDSEDAEDSEDITSQKSSKDSKTKETTAIAPKSTSTKDISYKEQSIESALNFQLSSQKSQTSQKFNSTQSSNTASKKVNTAVNTIDVENEEDSEESSEEKVTEKMKNLQHSHKLDISKSDTSKTATKDTSKKPITLFESEEQTEKTKLKKTEKAEMTSNSKKTLLIAKDKSNNSETNPTQKDKTTKNGKVENVSNNKKLAKEKEKEKEIEEIGEIEEKTEEEIEEEIEEHVDTTSQKSKSNKFLKTSDTVTTATSKKGITSTSSEEKIDYMEVDSDLTKPKKTTTNSQQSKKSITENEQPIETTASKKLSKQNKETISEQPKKKEKANGDIEKERVEKDKSEKNKSKATRVKKGAAGRTSDRFKKNRSTKSERAGVIFPVARVKRYLHDIKNTGRLKTRVTSTSAVYLAAVLEYMAAEVLEISGKMSELSTRKRVAPRHLLLAIRQDQELSKLLSNVVIPASGVVPNILPELFPKLKKKGKGIDNEDEKLSQPV